MEMNRTVIYARLSREDEDKIDRYKESRSIENQIKILKEYATNHNLDLKKNYIDDGYSGTNQERPGFQKLILDAYANKFDIILVKDISRLGRNMHQVGKLIEQTFPSLKIRLISINDNYDSLTYNDDESIVLRSFLNDYYIKDFRKKIHDSLLRRAKTKHMKSHYKYGYLLNEQGKIIIDPVASRVIKRIFEQYVMGYTPLEISRQLNVEGFLPPSKHIDEFVSKGAKKYERNSSLWKPSIITRIIGEYEYCGHIINLRHSNFYEEVLIKNKLPSIISEEIFQKANELKHSRKVQHYRIPHIGRLLIDPVSGKHPYYSTYNSEPRYVFRQSGFVVSCDTIHKLIKEEIFSFLCEIYKEPNRFLNVYKKKLFSNINTKEIENEIAFLNKNYEKIFELYYAKKMTENDYKKRCDEIKKKMNQLEQVKKDINLNINNFQSFYNSFIKYLEECKKNYFNDIEFFYDLIDSILVDDFTKGIRGKKEYKIVIKYKFENVLKE